MWSYFPRCGPLLRPRVHVLEEADESLYWIELITSHGILAADRLKPLLDEANELTAIFTTAVRTAKNNR